MQWFYNFKVATKLIAGFLIVAIIAGIVGIVGILNITKMDELDTEMYIRHTATMPDLAETARAYLRQRISLRNLYIEKDIDKRQDIINEFMTQKENSLTSASNFNDTINNVEVQNNMDLLIEKLNEFNIIGDEAINLINDNKMDEAYEIINGTKASSIAKAIQELTDTLFNLKKELASESSEINSTTARSSSTLMIITIFIGVLVAMILGVFISKTISNPVKKLVTAADMLAVGDVNVSIASNSKDEIGNLMDSFARMVANIRGQALAAEKVAAGDLDITVDIRSDNDLLGIKLSEMVDKNNEVLSNIRASSEQVAAGARQISESSVSLSQGATEQASSIEQLTASIEEIASQTKLNTQNANRANELAETVKQNADQGNTQMKEMLRAMDEINESSTNISKVIKVIDDIAFQTNILALNAAVEAARAGQHGKGFAVVAEEVRNLAARSANAAKETTEMIENSIKKADIGTRITKDTADALGNIVGGIEKVASLVNEISVASSEQELGITQINQGINQVSQVVQINSATSEESAAASEELSGQAELLQNMVRMFKLKNVTKTLTDSENNVILKRDRNPVKTIDLKKDLRSKIPYNEFEYGKY